MDYDFDLPAETPVFGALVTLNEGRSSHIAPCPKPLAGFLAQLLACSDGTAAYRARRRAEPAGASACYGAGAAAASWGAGPDADRLDRFL
jgi:hypothetical protein